MGPTSPSRSAELQPVVERTNSLAIMGTVFLDTYSVLAKKNVPMDPMKNSAVSSNFILSNERTPKAKADAEYELRCP